MTQEQLKLILDYIDAKINELEAAESSDGGLIESIIASNIKDQLLNTL